MRAGVDLDHIELPIIYNNFLTSMPDFEALTQTLNRKHPKPLGTRQYALMTTKFHYLTQKAYHG